MDDEKLNNILFTLQSIDSRLQAQEGRISKLEGNVVKAPVAVETVSAGPNDLVFGPVASIQPRRVSTPTPVVPKEKSEEWTGRMLGKIGIAAVLIGVAFFLQYSWGMMSNGVRVLLGTAIGATLIGLGNFLRTKYVHFGNLLTGGGLAALYLTIYYSKSVAVTSPGVALLLMSAVTVMAGVLSILGGTSTLAIVGIIGGFASPFLVGGGTDQYLSLLTYILFLDLAIAGIAIFKRWSHLNFLGFLGTIVVFSSVILNHNNLLFNEKMGFLIVFFLIYLLSATVHSLYRHESTEQIDILLTTLNAFYCLGMGLFIIQNSIFSPLKGFFVIVLTIIFLLLAIVVRRNNEEDTLLNIYLPSLSVIFLSLAIPIQLEGMWITLAWFAEALVLFLLFSESRLKIFSVFGVLVYVAGLFHLLFLDDVISDNAAAALIVNQRFFLFTAAILVAYVIFYIFNSLRSIDQSARQTAVFFLVTANILTIGLFTLETNSYFNRQYDYQLAQEQIKMMQEANYQGQAIGDAGPVTYGDYAAKQSSDSRRNTAVSVVWGIYAIILLAIGFIFKQKILRTMGIILFLVTACLIFSIIWSLGAFYRIITSIIYGVLALLGSFAYAKYKDKLKEVV